MTRPRSIKAVHATALLVVVAILTACGVPTHQSAREVAVEDVPFGLLDEDRAITTPDDTGEPLAIYLAKEDRLAPALRLLEPPVTLDRLLGALSEGPTEAENAAGLRSALPDEPTFEVVSLARGTARVDLARPFTALSSADQTLALAQIVYTLTGRPGIGLVRFTLQGASTEVLRANGSLTAAPVSRDDYRTLAPPA
jgi:hypothetical protein